MVCMLLLFWCTRLSYLHLIEIPLSVKLSGGLVIILMYLANVLVPTLNLNYQFKLIKSQNTVSSAER